MRVKQALRETKRIAREYTLGTLRNARRGPLSVVPSAYRILRARARYGVGPVYYSLYRFAQVPEAQWGEYVTDDPAFKQYLLDMSPKEMHALLRNKVLFHGHCRRHGIPTIPVLCALGRSPDALEGVEVVSTLERWLAVMASAPRELFVKPIDGTHGIGAFVVTRTGDRYFCDGRTMTSSDLYAHLLERLEREQENAWIVQPRLRVHPTLVGVVSPDALATVRAITRIRDGEARLLIADLKIPAGHSPVDNFAKGSTGNLLAAIDHERGRLSAAWGSVRRDWPVIERFDSHPRTGRTITGQVLPFWNEIVELALRAHRSLPEIPSIGWDVAASSQGLIVVEANVSYDLSILQIAHQRGLRREITTALAN